MAAVTIHSDFRAWEEEICHCFHLFPFYFPWSDRTDAMILDFLKLSFKPALKGKKDFLETVLNVYLISAPFCHFVSWAVRKI